MKLRFLSVFCILLLLLSGCSGLISDEYLDISEHDDPFAYREETEPTQETEEQPLTASNYYGMRSILSSFVRAGIEHGQLRLVDYDADVEQDLKRVVKYLTSDDPVSAYAIDYFNCERYSYRGDWVITVNAVYRRSVSEIEAITPVRGNEAAMERFTAALEQFQPSMTLQISGFTEEDFAAQLYRHCLEHPELMPEVPQISVSVYPDHGNVRVVETHYTYTNDSQTLRAMRSEAESVLTSAFNYIRFAQSSKSRVSLINNYLTSRFHYKEHAGPASVYSLLCQGVGDSRSFASVAAYLCNRCEIECSLVSGTKQELEYDWNIVLLDDGYHHIDLYAAALAAAPVSFLGDEEMEQYDWDRELYPVCVPEAAETEEPTEEG